ncbi:hypothetical protein [Bacillus paralicheniformis]
MTMKLSFSDPEDIVRVISLPLDGYSFCTDKETVQGEFMVMICIQVQVAD